jgi:CO/xanthine dehydrogenase Mo-binding subunit
MVLVQIAAEELGISLDRIKLIAADTDLTPDAGTTAATRQTYTSGNAVKMAAQQAKEPLLEQGAKMLAVNTVQGLIVRDDQLLVKGFTQQALSIAQVAAAALAEGRVLTGKACFTTHSTAVDPETGQGAPYYPYTFATQIAEVEVDTLTGKVEVLQIIAAHDVGRAINRSATEGQIRGGVLQGVGWALTEEINLSEGRITNGSFTEYLIPTMLDAPEITPLLVESYEETGPYGAKGVGETALLPAMPAIFNAIYDAVGIRLTTAPATPERVLQALAAKENGQSLERLSTQK